MRKILLLIGALALLLAACRAEINLVIDVAEDGVTTAAVEIGMDEEFQQLIGSGGGDPSEILGGGFDFGAVGEGESYQREEDGLTYWGSEATFSSFEELSANLANPADGDSPFSSFSFEQDDEQATLRATLSTPEDEVNTGEIPFDPSQITSEVFAVNLIFGMPGNVEEHNADRVLADGRLLWEIPLVGGEKEVFAQSSFGSSSLWWVWLVLGIVLVAGIAAVIIATMRSRRRSEEAIEAAGAEAADLPEESAVAVTPEPADEAGDAPTDEHRDE